MANVLEQYYQGILQQLRSEVDFINSLFEHQGVKGEGNETVLRDLIKRFIPKKYGVGTGVVIDRLGAVSRQCDIVIYDTFQYPALFSLTSVHMFPVDIVYATVEVKTTLTSGSAHEARQNIASVRGLSMIPGSYTEFISRGEGLAMMQYEPEPPLGVVFAYDSDVRKFETFKGWLFPATEAEAPLFPVLVGCLDQGLIVSRDLSGKRVEDRQSSLYPRLLGSLLPDGTGSFEVVDPAVGQRVAYAERDGTRYPVKQIPEGYVLVDQSKVLLNFLLVLGDMLDLKSIRPGIRFSEHYATPTTHFRLVH